MWNKPGYQPTTRTNDPIPPNTDSAVQKSAEFYESMNRKLNPELYAEENEDDATEEQSEILDPADAITWEPAPDPVNHPAHYTDGGIETIDFIEAKKLCYHLGNAVKYISRAGKKVDEVEDLRKAIWYLERRIKVLEDKTCE